jgi:hypothetical protein
LWKQLAQTAICTAPSNVFVLSIHPGQSTYVLHYNVLLEFLVFDTRHCNFIQAIFIPNFPGFRFRVRNPIKTAGGEPAPVQEIRGRLAAFTQRGRRPRPKVFPWERGRPRPPTYQESIDSAESDDAAIQSIRERYCYRSGRGRPRSQGRPNFSCKILTC